MKKEEEKAAGKREKKKGKGRRKREGEENLGNERDRAVGGTRKKQREKGKISAKTFITTGWFLGHFATRLSPS